MNWNTIRPWLATLARLVLGGVFFWAAWSKLHDPRRFVQAVRAYDVTPEWLSKAIGYGLPVLEICLAALLIVGVAVRLTALVAGLLLVTFLFGVIEASARGIKLDCGCFGGGGVTAGPTNYLWDVLRDLLLIAVAVFLVLWPMSRVSIESFVARHDYVEPPSAKRMRTEQGQRKYNAMLAAREKEARERALYVNSSLAVIVVLVSVIGIGVQSGRAKISGDLAAANATVKDGVVFGKKAAATVDIYEDFQCPHCKTFEGEVAATLEPQVRANVAQVRYHPLAFLDAGSNGNRYSSRAANAAICASDVSPDAFVAYHRVLFGKDKNGKDVQPAEGSDGRTDNDLITYAQQAGLTPEQVTAFTTCVQEDKHKALVQAITEAASKRGVTGTPTVYVNGSKLKNTDLKSLEAAIAEAGKKGPAPSPSVTPSPTPTAKPSVSASVSRSVSPSVSPSVSAKPTPSGSASRSGPAG